VKEKTAPARHGVLSASADGAGEDHVGCRPHELTRRGVHERRRCFRDQYHSSYCRHAAVAARPSSARLRLPTILREHKVTRQCAVERVDSGRPVSPKTVASALSARDDDPTTRTVESGSVLFCCRSYPLVALCGEYPTGCGKRNPCANSVWEMVAEAEEMHVAPCRPGKR
jgi:hypothetical protein